MSMERNPFKNLEEQFEQIQRQFEEAIRMWNGEQFEMPRITSMSEMRMGIDLADRGDEFVLTADVPGFEKDDIELRLADDTLHIVATREEEKEHEERDELYLKTERARRSMQRSIDLPEPVDEDAAEATCKNGVLTITLPKTEPGELDGETIEIKT